MTVKNVSALVKNLLINEPDTRNSDITLYRRAIETVAQERGVDLNRVPVTVFLTYSGSEGYPTFETVSRTRRKIRRTYPELCGVAEVEYGRMERETEFKNYAIGEC